MKHKMNKKGFTLVELLIVIGILGVLASVVVVVLQPAELLAQARDSQRMQDLTGLNSALSLYMVSTTVPTFGTTAKHSKTGVAVAGDCGHQVGVFGVLAADNRKITGAGWLQVDMSTLIGGSPISALPIDPVNDASYFYCYMGDNTNKNWELLAKALESTKYGGAAGTGVDFTDGGDEPTSYEVGTHPNLDLM